MESREKAMERLRNKYNVHIDWAPLLWGNGSYVVESIDAGHTIREAERVAKRFKEVI
jgi:hypothetical protein